LLDILDFLSTFYLLLVTFGVGCLLVLGVTHLRASAGLDSTSTVLAVVHHVCLVFEHFLLCTRVLFHGLEFFDLCSKFGNQHDQLHIFRHDVHVLLLVNLFLLLETAFQTVLRILQISSLVLELLLDIGIDLNILSWLILDIWVQILVNNLLQLIKVIDVLDAPINSIFELSNFDVVLSDLGSIVSNHVDHVFLSSLQIVNDITQVCIDLIIVSQVLIHLISLLLESCDLLTSWSDVSL